MTDIDTEGVDEAEVVWEGDCLEVVRSFPKPIREDLGADIRRLQVGVKPLNSRPMHSIGKRVYELRQMDDKGWYRVIYLGKVGNRLHMLHAFMKKSAKTSANDLRIATARLKAVNARLTEEKKMPAKASKPAHVSRGNVFEDLGFTAEEAAILAMKTQLHIEIMRAVRQQKLTPRQLEKMLAVPQPRVSELMNGKISRMTADLLTKYLYRLGREVTMKTKTRRGRITAMA